MDFKLLLVFTIVSMVLLVPDGVDAWRRRSFRFRGRRWVKPLCRRFCSPVCTYYTGKGRICQFGCRNICGKRSLDGKDAANAIDPDFTVYDTDKDGFISKEEFTNYFHADAQNVDEVYDAADDDRDGKLSEEEFDETFGISNDEAKAQN